MKTLKKLQYYELLGLAITSFALIFVISIPLQNMLLSLILSFIYLIFFFLPFLPLISSLNIGFLEKYMLCNLAGLGYAAIFALLDVLFKIKLTKLLFIASAIIIPIISWKYIKRNKN